ncbi:MAG: hypothetical protein ACKOJD_07260, partial [Candidatus Limnocylindrus sp.]
LRSRTDFDVLIARIDASGTQWMTRPEVHSDPALSGKFGGKLSDPSGNVIEIKFYDEVSDLLAKG